MFINLSPGALGLHQTPFETLLALAPAHGFGGIDLPLPRLATRQEAREARGRVEQAGLRWGLTPLPCDFLQVDEAGFEAGLVALERQLPIIAAAGCTRAYNHVWPGSDERAFDENFAWHVARLERLAKLLASGGVRLGIEFLGPLSLQRGFRHPFIRDLRSALALVDAVPAPLGIVLDCFHWFCSGGSLAELETLLAGRALINVHANDATPGRGAEEQVDTERRLPLESGVIDAAAVLRVLRGLNYDGPVIPEPFKPHVDRFARLPAHKVLGEVGPVMTRLFAEAAR